MDDDLDSPVVLRDTYLGQKPRKEYQVSLEDLQAFLDQYPKSDWLYLYWDSSDICIELAISNKEGAHCGHTEIFGDDFYYLDLVPSEFLAPFIRKLRGGFETDDHSQELYDFIENLYKRSQIQRPFATPTRPSMDLAIHMGTGLHGSVFSIELSNGTDRMLKRAEVRRIFVEGKIDDDAFDCYLPSKFLDSLGLQIVCSHHLLLLDGISRDVELTSLVVAKIGELSAKANFVVYGDEVILGRNLVWKPVGETSASC